MTSSIPFSIEPDAEDYLRSYLVGLSPQRMPVLMMTTLQSDGLKPPRWLYKGESFVVGYIHPHERSKMEFEVFHLLGRGFAIESNALKHLSGRTLALRRVNSRYGLFRNARYVLIGASVPQSRQAVTQDLPEEVKGYMSVAALAILGGFSGMGALWIAYAIIGSALKFSDDRLFGARLIFPLLITGWILGAVVSFIFFRSILKNDGTTRYHKEQRQRRYLGQPGINLDWWIFIGVPAPLIVLAILIIGRFVHTQEQEAYGSVAAFMVIFGCAMYFCDRMPRRLVFWLGIFGWLLTLIVGYWFFRFHGP